MWGYLNGEVECPLIKIRFKEPNVRYITSTYNPLSVSVLVHKLILMFFDRRT